jgi:hypothetical protein
MTMRLAIVGADTSHATEFTARLHDASHPEHVPGTRVVAALPAASADIPLSAQRVQGFTATLRDELGVKIVSSWEEVLSEVDGILILSLDGRPHLQQVKRALEARVPVFLDKPVAASLAEAEQIYALAEQCGVPLYSSSALRWHPQVRSLQSAEAEWFSTVSIGPAPGLEHHPDLFFYGIHPTEALFTVLGPDCLRVSATRSARGLTAVGEWASGETGHLITLAQHGAQYSLFRAAADQRLQVTLSGGFYGPLLQQIVQFMRSGVSPVSAQETLAIYRFMAGAKESADRGGASVRLSGL